MPAVTLKKLLGDGGAGLDDSMGIDTLRAVLVKLITEHKNIMTQFNQLRTDYNAETAAAHTATTATAVSSSITVEP
jgi:hypothetical protein